MGSTSMNETKISRKLSFLLRHSIDPLVIDLDGGWADVGEILSLLHIDSNMLWYIVQNDEKGRYSFDDSGKYIRANQGHSIPGVEIEMERPEPPDFLYHGTSTKCIDVIMKDGLKPQSRRFVHISNDYETAVNVGKRHGKPVILEINAKDFVRDGHLLYRSSNGVWQANEVPTKYFKIKSFG